MKLRIAASFMSVMCAWVLWEKWIVFSPGEPTQRIIQAVSETKTLEECRSGLPLYAKNRAEGFRKAYKEPDYGVIESPFGVILSDKQRKTTPQQYVFYCLPSTIDPYHEPQ